MKQNLLDDLYKNYAGNTECIIQCKELNETIDKIIDILHNDMNLNDTDIDTLVEYIANSQCIAQKQGFISGFCYAVQIMMECTNNN